MRKHLAKMPLIGRFFRKKKPILDLSGLKQKEISFSAKGPMEMKAPEGKVLMGKVRKQQ